MRVVKQRQKRRYICGKFTKRLILKAARERFLTEGYAKITIRMVSDSAQIGYGTFYTHFKSKDAVLKYFVDQVVYEVFRNYGQPVPCVLFC